MADLVKAIQAWRRFARVRVDGVVWVPESEAFEDHEKYITELEDRIKVLEAEIDRINSA